MTGICIIGINMERRMRRRRDAKRSRIKSN
jgi:hypothetical protein